MLTYLDGNWFDEDRFHMVPAGPSPVNYSAIGTYLYGTWMDQWRHCAHVTLR